MRSTAKPIDPEPEHRGRCAGHGEEALGDLVDGDIGGLRREDHRDQELERTRIAELGRGTGIVRL
jgi:hypothetical protein